MSDKGEPKVGIGVDDVKTLILGQVDTLPARTVPLMDAWGCVLAEDVIAGEPFPLFDNSAMDGYALRHNDISDASRDRPVTLRVLEDLPAGQVATHEVGPGEAIRIMTGAPVPEGADSVVKVEETDSSDGIVRVFAAAWDGQNIRRAGEDVAVGDEILPRGMRLRAGAIGMLANLGRPEIRVIPRPVIAVISTGDELIDVSEPLQPGKIRNSNAYSLATQVLECGAVPRIEPIARDTEEDLRAVIARACTADAIVTSGGVSVGDYDLVKTILDDLGQMLFWKVKQRPGKPMAFGIIGETPLFGLPGNPTAAMTSFEQYVRPAILEMSGRPVTERQLVEVTIGEDLRKRPGLRYFVSVVLSREDGRLVARPAGTQGSGALRAMTRAHGLLVLPEDTDKVAAGDTGVVQVIYPEDVPL